MLAAESDERSTVVSANNGSRKSGCSAAATVEASRNSTGAAQHNQDYETAHAEDLVTIENAKIVEKNLVKVPALQIATHVFSNMGYPGLNITQVQAHVEGHIQ